MGESNYYSIRMHASRINMHVSGAERIVCAQKIESTVSELIGRAMRKDCTPDRVTVTIDDLGNGPLRTLKALDIITVNAPDSSEARTMASDILQNAGVAENAALQALNFLSKGASPSGENMRGAMIIDCRTGERLETDRARGVRASRFDWSDEARERIKKELADNGLSHFRTCEALALATKIAHGPGVIAEICWSDDPDYTAGYVASLKTGYIRFPFMKQIGNKTGGRAIFVDRNGFDARASIDFLQDEPVLIDGTGKYNECGDAIELRRCLKRHSGLDPESSDCLLESLKKT